MFYDIIFSSGRNPQYMKELQMNENMYVTLHGSADRLALEAVRRMNPFEDEAVCYKDIYNRTMKFLVEQHKQYTEED